jgi:hypothetical protein
MTCVSHASASSETDSEGAFSDSDIEGGDSDNDDSEREAREDSEEWDDDDDDEPRGPWSPSVVLRLSAEYAASFAPLLASGWRLEEGLSTQFDQSWDLKASTGGIRALAGWSFPVGRSLHLVPRASGSIHFFGTREFSVTVVGADHRFQATPTYWQLAAGVELQFFDAMWLVSLEIGAGGVRFQQEGTGPLTPGLEIELDELYGVHGRLDMSLRLPSEFFLGAGVTIGADTFYDNEHSVQAYRGLAGLFIEIDGRRLKDELQK